MEVLDQVAAYFRALSESTRLHMLSLLRSGERNVGELAKLCNYTSANISRHLAILSKHSLVVFVHSLTPDVDVGATVAHHLAQARAGLKHHGSESQMPSVQAWRKAYRAIGTDPTKFRMAAESLLRRLRLVGDLPGHIYMHPLVLLRNALSARFAMPIAVLDSDQINGNLQVRMASGDKEYQAFDGTMSKLSAGEVTFKDEAGIGIGL